MLGIKECIVIVEKRITPVNLCIFNYKLFSKLCACAPSVWLEMFCMFRIVFLVSVLQTCGLSSRRS